MAVYQAVSSDTKVGVRPEGKSTESSEPLGEALAASGRYIAPRRDLPCKRTPDRILRHLSSASLLVFQVSVPDKLPTLPIVRQTDGKLVCVSLYLLQRYGVDSGTNLVAHEEKRQ